MLSRVGFALAIILFGLSMPIHAQFNPIEVGFKAGAPLSDLVKVKGADADSGDHSVPFAAGGLLQLNLPIGFAIEANALYKRPGYHIGAVQRRQSQWEFPVLVKGYPLGRNPVIQPYAGAGISFRHTSTKLADASANEGNRGLVLAAGIRNGPGRIKISPEFRFTRWFSATRLFSGLQGDRAETNKNQLEFLVGITF